MNDEHGIVLERLCDPENSECTCGELVNDQLEHLLNFLYSKVFPHVSCKKSRDSGVTYRAMADLNDSTYV